MDSIIAYGACTTCCVAVSCVLFMIIQIMLYEESLTETISCEPSEPPPSTSASMASTSTSTPPSPPSVNKSNKRKRSSTGYSELMKEIVGYSELMKKMVDSLNEVAESIKEVHTHWISKVAKCVYGHTEYPEHVLDALLDDLCSSEIRGRVFASKPDASRKRVIEEFIKNSNLSVGSTQVHGGSEDGERS